MRDTTKWFAGLMEKKLAENDNKEPWEESEIEFLFHRIKEEIQELEDALFDYVFLSGQVAADSVKYEAADVANFAMMIASKVDEIMSKNLRGEKVEGHETGD